MAEGMYGNIEDYTVCSYVIFIKLSLRRYSTHSYRLRIQSYEPPAFFFSLAESVLIDFFGAYSRGYMTWFDPKEDQHFDKEPGPNFQTGTRDNVHS